MKTSGTKNQSKKQTPKQPRREQRSVDDLRRGGMNDRKFVHFPQVKGRVVENIELFTMADFHSITIDFRDKTQFNLMLEPSLLIASNMADMSTGEQHILKRWPTVRSITRRD